MSKPNPQFFAKVMGKIQGPFTSSQIRKLAQTGRLLPSSHIRKGTQGNWTTADQIKGLSFAPKPLTRPISPTAPAKPPTKPASKRKYLVPVLSGCAALLLLVVSVVAYLILTLVSALTDSPDRVSSADSKSTQIAQTPSMPKIDQTKIVTPTISEEPFYISSGNFTYSFDINDQYICVMKTHITADKLVRIFDLRDGSQVKEVSFGDEFVGSVSINSDLSRMLVKPKYGTELKLLDISNEPKKIKDIALKRLLRKDLNRISSNDFHFFPSTKNFVTCESPNRRLSMWNAKNGELLFHNSKVRFEGIKSNVTPDGNFVYHGITDGPRRINRYPGRVIHYVDVSTGKVAGTVALDVANDDCRMPRLSPDGEKMLCVSKKGGATRTVTGFDATTGKRLFQMPFPANASKIHWLQNDHFVIGNVLASFKQKKILARLKNFKPNKIVESTGQAIFADRYYDVGYVLTAKNIVDEVAEIPELAAAKTTYHLKQQDAIALDLKLPAKVPIRGLEGKLTTSITKALTKAGFRVQKNAAVTLKLTVSEAPTGKVNQFEEVIKSTGRFVHTRPEGELPEIALRCLMTFSDQSGKFYEKEVSFTVPRDEFKINFMGTMENSIKTWRWNQLLTIDEKYFSREYVSFEIADAEINFKPDEAWLAKTKKAEAAKRAAKQKTERKND